MHSNPPRKRQNPIMGDKELLELLRNHQKAKTSFTIRGIAQQAEVPQSIVRYYLKKIRPLRRKNTYQIPTCASVPRPEGTRLPVHTDSFGNVMYGNAAEAVLRRVAFGKQKGGRHGIVLQQSRYHKK